MVEALVHYGQITGMWVRASRAYPVSFWLLMTGSLLVNVIDFVGIWIVFSNVHALGGFGFHEVAFLYGSSGLGIAIANMVVGEVGNLGQQIRLGRLDQMMVRPVSLLVQVCAEEFSIRRLGRLAQALAVFAWACAYVDWTLGRALVAAVMVVSGTVIFGALFIGLACIQFWTTDSAEVANAFTYGGNTVTSYPLSVFPHALVRTLTFVVPLAFINWYPSLYVLGRSDPLGLPGFTQLLSPAVAVLFCLLAALAWRTGVRQYRSTGS